MLFAKPSVWVGLATQTSLLSTTITMLAAPLGALIGEALNLEKHLEDFGVFCQNRLKSSGDSHFVEGFVSFSLLICIGAMAIVGSLQDGLSGDASLLIAKAIIDGIAAVVFAASLGKGVFLSVLPLGVYQGGLTLLARFIRPWMTDELIAQMSCVGSVLIFAVSLNMIRKDKIKVGNLLPAVFLPTDISWKWARTWLRYADVSPRRGFPCGRSLCAWTFPKVT